MRWATLDKSLYPSFLPAQKGPNNAYLLGCEEQIYNGHLTPYFLEFACGANVVSTDHDGEMSALKSTDTPWGLKRQCPGENCSQDLGVWFKLFLWLHVHFSSGLDTLGAQLGRALSSESELRPSCRLCSMSLELRDRTFSLASQSATATTSPRHAVRMEEI